MSNKVGVYCRISLDWEDKQLGVQRQETDGRKVAAVRGWQVATVYKDNNKSAFKPGVVRPEFERMLSDLESGRIDGIVAYDLDRISRQPVVLERLIAIYENQLGRVFATVQGDIDFSTSDGITMARIMVTIANKSSRDSSRRIKRKNVERAEAGLPHGSRRPFGYCRGGMAIDAKEWGVLQSMRVHIIDGWSYKEIAYQLNKDGIRTTEGKLWYPITIRNMLRKPRYAGIRTHNGSEYPAAWQPVFTPDQWDQLQYVLRTRREVANAKPARKYLLTGILVCGKCGNYLNGETKRDRKDRPLRHVYNCRPQGNTQKQGGCGGVTRNAPALEEFIRQLIVYRLDTENLGKLLGSDSDDGKLRQLLNDRQVKKDKLVGLENDYADDSIDKAQFVRLTQRVQAALQDLDEQVAAMQRERLSVRLDAGQTVAEAWQENPNGWKRQLIELMIKQVTVNVGKGKPFFSMPDGTVARFDPSLIHVSWRV